MTSSQNSGTETEEKEDVAQSTDDAGEAPVESDSQSSASEPNTDTESDDAPVEAAVAADDTDGNVGGGAAETARRDTTGVVAGAAAVVGAGLGLASLTGTWLSDLMSSRQELIGQVNGQTATPQEQVATIFGSPWHTTALFNGFFALAAIIASVVALAIPAFGKRAGDSPSWIRAVAFGGLALGVIGLVIAAVMWFDVFTDLPAVPTE